jgi:hypothetical protein
MKYILITSQGRVREFYILATAELYQTLEGGTVISTELLVDNKSQPCYNT